MQIRMHSMHGAGCAKDSSATLKASPKALGFGLLKLRLPITTFATKKTHTCDIETKTGSSKEHRRDGTIAPHLVGAQVHPHHPVALLFFDLLLD